MTEMWKPQTILGLVSSLLSSLAIHVKCLLWLTLFFFPFSSPPLPYCLSLCLPFLFPFPCACLLVHSQSRLCSPLHSLFSSLQAPVPRSFCQSLHPSSTTWYKFRSPFLSCPCVACISGCVCLGQSVTTLQSSCAFWRAMLKGVSSWEASTGWTIYSI